MDDSDPDTPPRISAEFRNGSVTAVGVVGAFSLSFITAWAGNPTAWTVRDVVAVVPLAVGIGFQLWSFATLLDPRSLKTEVYRRAIRRFLGGLVLVALGIGVAIVADIFVTLQR